MATRKNIQIADAIGADPEQVQAVLSRVNPSTRAQWIYCADQLGCDVHHLVNEAAKPAPVPLLPRNWSKTSTGPYTTAYAGPQGGFTSGAPIPGRPDGT